VFDGERRHRQRCGGDVTLDEAADRVAAEMVAAGSWEQRVARRPVVLAEPCSQDRLGFLAAAG
jgi:hypothetical protein